VRFPGGASGEAAWEGGGVSLFVGVFPPAEAIAHLSKVVDGLGLSKHITPDRWHVTVAFLGDADEKAAAKAMDQAELRPMGELSVKGAGQFGTAVFWAGLVGDIEGLRRLNKNVRRAMRAQRVTPDDRYYRPHLTLARLREEAPSQAMEAMRAYHGPSWPVTELTLVRSVQGPQPEYHRLGAWSLSPA
jgi:2'-5' RNA ligase